MTGPRPYPGGVGLPGVPLGRTVEPCTGGENREPKRETLGPFVGGPVHYLNFYWNEQLAVPAFSRPPESTSKVDCGTDVSISGRPEIPPPEGLDERGGRETLVSPSRPWTVLLQSVVGEG